MSHAARSKPIPTSTGPTNWLVRRLVALNVRTTLYVTELDLEHYTKHGGATPHYIKALDLRAQELRAELATLR